MGSRAVGGKPGTAHEPRRFIASLPKSGTASPASKNISSHESVPPQSEIQPEVCLKYGCVVTVSDDTLPWAVFME